MEFYYSKWILVFILGQHSSINDTRCYICHLSGFNGGEKYFGFPLLIGYSQTGANGRETQTNKQTSCTISHLEKGKILETHRNRILLAVKTIFGLSFVRHWNRLAHPNPSPDRHELNSSSILFLNIKPSNTRIHNGKLYSWIDRF